MANDLAVIEPNPVLIESHPAPPKDIGKLGSTDRTSSAAQKYHKAFAELETPKEPVKEATSPEPQEATKTEQVVPVEPDKSDVKTPSSKPESPLDVVLDKPTKEPEKVEDVPDVVKQFDDINVPKSEHWKRARGVMSEQSTKIRELEAKLSAPKVAPEEVVAHTKRIEELEQALADRETRLKAAGAEYSPDYQKLVGKYQTTAEKIKNRMESFGADGNSLLSALSMPYSKARTDQIDTALSDLDAGKQGRIQSLIEELEGHGEEIAEFRKDLPARYEEMTAKQEQAAREQQVNAIKQMETEFLKIVEQLPDNVKTLREVPDDVPGGTEWNKEIKEAQANALRILKPDGSDFNESAAIALKGARYDSLEKRYLSLHSEYRELKKTMAQYDESGPDFKGGLKPKSATQKTAPVKFREALHAIKSGEMADI